MEIVLASILAFSTTNLDDIFILTLFFSNPEFKSKNIIAGQYLGIMALIGISLVGSFIGLIIDPKFIGLLGLIPIYMGIKSALNLTRKKVEEERNIKVDTPDRNTRQVISVSSVTIANGGDNISIYVPLFTTLAMSEKLLMTFIFLLMTALWCFLAWYSSKHPMIQQTIKKYGHVITPFVFILLGLYIMYESDTFRLFFGN